MPFDKKKGQIKGFAHVIMNQARDAERVLQVGKHFINGLRVSITPWLPKESYTTVKNSRNLRKLYVRMPVQLSETDLTMHFIQFGSVEEVALKFDVATNHFRGFCYVVFHTQTAAQKAAAFEDHRIGGLKLRCEMHLPA